MKVLIADNSELMLIRLQEKLMEFESLRIIGIAKNGRDALDKMKLTSPDLAIIDLDMPGLNGFDVLTEIRKTNSEMKIILLTLSSSVHYKRKAFKSGADYFFSKADDFENILLVISEIVSNSTVTKPRLN